jgi:hypothetical protein
MKRRAQDVVTPARKQVPNIDYNCSWLDAALIMPNDLDGIFRLTMGVAGINTPVWGFRASSPPT